MQQEAQLACAQLDDANLDKTKRLHRSQQATITLGHGNVFDGWEHS